MIHPESDRGRRYHLRQALVLYCTTPLLWAAPVLADYTLVLKNGRQITVQTYSEDKGMIQLSVPGGQISIERDKIQSIFQSEAIVTEKDIIPHPGTLPKPPKKSVREGEGETPSPSGQEIAENGQVPSESREKTLSPEERRAEQRAEEEKEYQGRIKVITGRIKAVMDRYALATRGKTGPEPTLLKSPEAISARTADLNSRLKDARHNPAGPRDAGGIDLDAPAAFSGAPGRTIRLRPGGVIRRVNPPLAPYSQKERELSDLRKQLNQLQNQRTLLIQEMRQKHFNTSSLFLP